MQKYFSIEHFDEINDVIRSVTKYEPKIGLILGSGLGKLADSVQDASYIPYEKLPHWPVSTVEGHKGRLVIGILENKPVMVLQGRIHFYEGYSMSQVTLPVRVMQRFGIDTVIITNAAGGINQDFIPGDLMLITDHLNLVGMAGFNPLMGPNLDEFGPRFPDMSQAYDRKLQELARKTAADQDIVLREGVYVGLSGPSFETPADLRFLRAIGCDAVGMSTVPEVTVARHGGMKVLGISGISNQASLDGLSVTTHEEVMEVGKVIAPKLGALILGILRAL